MDDIKLELAIDIVLQLARGNVIDAKEVSNDPEVLEPIRLQQEEAIHTVRDFFANVVFN